MPTLFLHARKLFALLSLLFAATFSHAKDTGFLDRTLQIDGAEYRYVVYVPRDHDSAKLWPVILALHGGGEYGSDGLQQTIGALATAIRRNPERFPAIVVFPQAHRDGTPGWQLQGGKAALAELDAAVAEFHGDPTREYLTGYSAGGNGTWYLAMHNPHRFAAIVPICAFVTDFRGKASNVWYPSLAPASAPDPYAAVARAVASLPIWIFHGDQDPTVPVDESRRMYAALQALRANVHYTELPGIDHRAWDPAYANAEMITWLFQQKLEPTH